VDYDDPAGYNPDDIKNEDEEYDNEEDKQKDLTTQ
jgi:hypothetical protein